MLEEEAFFILQSANRKESQGEELDLQEFDAVAETEGGFQAHMGCCSHAVHQVPEQRENNKSLAVLWIRIRIDFSQLERIQEGKNDQQK